MCWTEKVISTPPYCYPCRLNHFPLSFSAWPTVPASIQIQPASPRTASSRCSSSTLSSSAQCAYSTPDPFHWPVCSSCPWSPGGTSRSLVLPFEARYSSYHTIPASPTSRPSAICTFARSNSVGFRGRALWPPQPPTTSLSWPGTLAQWAACLSYLVSQSNWLLNAKAKYCASSNRLADFGSRASFRSAREPFHRIPTRHQVNLD